MVVEVLRKIWIWLYWMELIIIKKGVVWYWVVGIIVVYVLDFILKNNFLIECYI